MPETISMPELAWRRRVAQCLDHLSTLLPSRWLGMPVNDRGVPLSPQLHWLLRLRELTTPLPVDPHPEHVRRGFRRDLLALRVRYPVHAVEELRVPGGAGELAARLYRPAPAGALPALLVFFHGGGFVLGDLDTHDDVCRLLCRDSGMAVLSVDYRLAPEHPFPAPVEDALAAVRWVQANAARFGVRPEAVAVGGDSAGGNLAAVVAQLLAAAGESGRGTALLGQLLVYPATDRVTVRDSHRHFGAGYFLSHEDREWFYKHYLAGDMSLGADVRVSPLLHPAPGKLAPALVACAGFDMLRDEGEAYAAHLAAHGTTVELLRMEPLGHGFLSLAAVHRESAQAARQIALAWRALCQRAQPSPNPR
jgi:acetyl esterase